ncbi:MAG TPA: ComF family protein [Candidatus Dormibacteraeota bacterium]|nr:ComF family protein [Candidatus Dormibacteraeota bacterium]
MIGLGTTAREWLNAGLSFFYPEICQICGQDRASPEECYLCTGCRGRVKHIEPPFCERCGLPYEGAITTAFECANCKDMDMHFSSARSVAAAKGELLEVIHKYKYARAMWFEPFLGELLAERAAPVLQSGKWDLIVPIPLHATKQREREFNQAERLGSRLSDATGIPLATGLVRRVVATRTQTQLTRAERVTNMKKAFAMQEGMKLSGERLVLIDDVFTTGATASACAKALRAAGAAEVCVWTVARGT